jgi:7-cyano-7-deazaguanine tRNA-ribosyltransferase
MDGDGRERGIFEIRGRDAMGRLGLLEVGSRRFQTPLILPVVHPWRQEIPPSEIRNMGFEGIITNAYLLHKDPELRERALEVGVHRLLGFDGLVMTDSGSYQLSRYRGVDIGAEEVVRFQEGIGSDIGVILDIPTPPDADRRRAEADLEETLRRGKASLSVRENLFLAGTVQGSTHLDLREHSAREMGSLDFDLHPIGGVVSLLEAYRFRELADIILHAKRHLPPQRPVHLFGCGHPLIFAFAVALGCDLFDSAAYALYAKEGRYITPEGTLRLKELEEFPCTCPVCSSMTPGEMAALFPEERWERLARHNLHVTFEEMKRVRQALRRGSLWELVERRARSHPRLLEALRHALTWPDLEEVDPVTKPSAFFYSGPESLQRPEVKRHRRWLKRWKPSARELVLLPWGLRPDQWIWETFSNERYQVCGLSPIFGIVPLELGEVYPLAQHEGVETLDRDQWEGMRASVLEYMGAFKKVHIHRDLSFLGLPGEPLEDFLPFGDGDIPLKLRALAEYQFGAGTGTLMMEGAEVEFSRTGRIRRIRSREGLLIATLRASDGFLVLGEEGAKRLQRALPSPRRRVGVEDEAASFALQGRSVFARFVTLCDPEIRPAEECLVVDREDRLLAVGKALLTGKEMIHFQRGVAVRVRRGFGSEAVEEAVKGDEDDPSR